MHFITGLVLLMVSITINKTTKFTICCSDTFVLKIYIKKINSVSQYHDRTENKAKEILRIAFVNWETKLQTINVHKAGMLLENHLIY